MIPALSRDLFNLFQSFHHLRHRSTGGFWVDAGIDAPLTMSLEHHIAGSLAEVEAGVAVDFGRDAFTLKLATQRLRDISRAALDAAFTEADVDLIHTKRYHVEGDAVGRGFT